MAWPNRRCLAPSEPPKQADGRYFSAKALEEDQVHDEDAAGSGARSLVEPGNTWPSIEIAIVDATSSAEVAPVA